MTKTILYFICFIIVTSSTVSSSVLKGKLYNASTKTPIAFATVTSAETSQTVMTNEDGGFIFYNTKDITTLTCSHIAFFSQTQIIEQTSDTVEIDIFLNPSLIELPSIKVYERNYDAAQQIIIEAIRHKDEILSKLHSYQFEAYTKLTVWDASKADSLKPLLLTETELTAYWKYPSEYKEIITARKQSANLEAENNLVSVGEVLNFNHNRIDIGKSSLVSPTADDALKYYNYYLLDTLFYDSLPVFLLEIEPKFANTPLFIGTIQINANSYEIIGVDIAINEGLDSPYLKQFNYTQEYRLFNNEHWMPTVIKFDGLMDIPIPLIPPISFTYTAALQRYKFEKDYGDTIFNDYILEVDEYADDYDSTQWLSNRFIPLTYTELSAYEHIDSVKNNKPLYKKLLPIIPGAIFVLSTMQDFFHFNRVEGAYLGGKFDITTLDKKLKSSTKVGYAFDAKLWQQEYSLTYMLNKKHRFDFQTLYHDNIQTRKTLNSRTNGNATTLSLLLKKDPFDYFREKGFSLKTSIAPVKQTKFSISYNNFSQSSLSNNTNYAFFFDDSTYRKNLAITGGDMHSLKFDLTYDSNKKMNIKGKEESIFSYPYTNISLGAEISDQSFLKSDYQFKTVYGQFYTTRQLFGLGISSLRIYGTKKLSGQLPPQRYTTMDFGGNITYADLNYKTFSYTNFSGNSLLSIYYNHGFGTMLFKKSHIPLIEKIPYSFALYGGIFWSDLIDQSYNIDDEFISQTNNHAYSEIGFSIGRLPLLTKFYFTWQLSAYDTQNFTFEFGFGF